jgi:hypothetical protein
VSSPKAIHGPVPFHRKQRRTDEFVWGYVKSNGLRQKPLRKNEALKERVTDDLTSLKGNRKLVRSFFGAKSVAYARD